MSDVRCYRYYSNNNAENILPLDQLYQWDRNIIMVVRGLDGITSNVKVHFTNRLCEKAFVVAPPASDIDTTNNVIRVSIPNDLLKMPETIEAYIFDAKSGGTGTRFRIKLPVIPRTEDGSIYVNNMDEITSHDFVIEDLNVTRNLQVDGDIYTNGSKLVATKEYIDESINTIFDDFMTERRYANSSSGLYTVSYGGITTAGVRVPSADNMTHGVTELIEISRPLMIKIEDNTDENYYQINRVRGYTISDQDEVIPEETPILDSPLGRDDSLIIQPKNGRKYIAVSFRRNDDTADVNLTAISEKFRIYTPINGEIIYNGRDRVKNQPRVMTYFTGASGLTSLSDMPAWSMFEASDVILQPLLGENFPSTLTPRTTYILEKIEIGTDQKAYIYTLHSMTQKTVWGGYTTFDAPNDIVWGIAHQTTDKNLSQEGRAADAKKTGDLIDTIYDDLMIERRYANNASGLYTVYNGGLTTSGVRSQDTSNTNHGVTEYIEITKPLLIKLENNTDDNYYQINRVWGYSRSNQDVITPEPTPILDSPLGRDESFIIQPKDGRVYICVSFRRNDDTADVNLSAISEKFRVYAPMSSDVIYDGRDKVTNKPRVMTYFTGASGLTSLSDMPAWSMFEASDVILQPLLGENFPSTLTPRTTYVLEKTEIGTTQKAYLYTLYSMSQKTVWGGYTTFAAPNNIIWSTVNQPTDNSLSKEGCPADAAAVGKTLRACGSAVRILVFGNSFSYSDLGMLPALLTEYGVSVIFGILYYSGATIQDHIDHFNNQTPYSVFSYYNGQTWTNTWNTVTAQDALDTTEWDYIVLQSGNPINLETLTDLIINSVDYPFAFLFNNNHSGGANTESGGSPIGEEGSNNRFLQYATNARNLLENGNVILDVLPCGAAIQNARQLSVFKSIGDLGYLCHDGVGHLQNGIATLIPAYAAALKIMEIIGGKQKIFGSQVRPTDTWLEQYNLLTRYRDTDDPLYGVSHGASEGLTDTNVLLAAKCAIQAYKHPYEITTIN